MGERNRRLHLLTHGRRRCRPCRRVFWRCPAGAVCRLLVRAIIWAFEPNPDSFRFATRTIELNRLSNVILTNAALDAQPGEAALLTTRPDGVALGGASRIVASPESDLPVSIARTVTLDSIVPEDRRVSVIHLDVEGHEAFALAGAMRTIARCRPTLIFETVPPVPLGYRYEGKVNANTIFLVES
jgi:FkbM family methyltransferase